MTDKTFVWTTESAQRFFQLKFDNDWLFKKKRQPWKEFHNLLLQNGFPKEMTINHIRKKWSYTYDCYRIAKKTNNKKWIYYKIFDKHYGKTKALDRFDSWNDEWRLILIQSITQSTNPENQIIEWRLVESDLRSKQLPEDCCIQDIRALWHHLKVTFHRKYRVRFKKQVNRKKRRKPEVVIKWLPYDVMLSYYETFLPNSLVELDGDSDIYHIIQKGSKHCSKVTLRDSKEKEFHWNRDITETFINLRLQYEWLFREKKWAWNDFSTIMKKEYGFPTYLTARALCHKWASTYSVYQKAKATNNTNWIYYNLFESYLGTNVLGLELLKNWSEEWVQNLIRIKTDIEPFFLEVEKPSTAWREVEKKLRHEGLPIDHSLLQLPEMWMQLMKQYKWKKKFAKQGILTENWPYYESMVKFMDVSSDLYNKQTVILNEADDIEINGEEFDFDDEMLLFDLKKKLKDESFRETDLNSCRACGEVQGAVNLFEQKDDNGVSLAMKMKTLGGVEIDVNDEYPKQICLECLRELEIAFNFRKKCQHIDNKLRNFKSQDIKIEVDIKRDEMDVDNDFANEADNSFDLPDPEESTNDEILLQPKVKKVNETRKIVKPINKERKKYKYNFTRVCEICGKRTRNIKSHMDVHSTEKSYTCEQCGKKFKFKSGLMIHKASHDPVPKKTCEICGKTFHIMAQYKKHFVYHANVRKFSCETCGKAFHTKDILVVHTRMHTDERPFSCPECGKTFRTAGCVSRHRRIVHKKMGKCFKPLEETETFHLPNLS